MSYRDFEDFDRKIASIKNKCRRLQVICPEAEQPTIKSILDLQKVSAVAETVAFITAKAQTEVSELPSDSTLRK